MTEKSHKDKLEETQALHSNYEEAFELTGHGKFSYLTLLTCCLIFSYASLEQTGIAYIITPAECDLHFTVIEKSLVNCSVFIGIMATAICWGSISDRYGRRRVMLPCIVGSVTTSFLSSLCSSFWAMFTLRVLTGCLVAALNANVLVYLSELHTTKYRDTAISIVITYDQLNTAVLPVLAWLVVPGEWSFEVVSVVVKPWRVFMWFWAISGLTGAFLLFILPESPRYVLARQGPYATIPMLAKMYAWNNNKHINDFPVKVMTVASTRNLTDTAELRTILRNASNLLRPPLLRCYLLTHYCMFVVYILTNGIYIWLPGLINEMLVDTSRGATMCDLIYNKYIQSGEAWFEHLDPKDFPLSETGEPACEKSNVKTLMYPVTIAMECVYIIPYTMMMFLIHKFNHVKIFSCVMFFCAVCLFLSSVVPQILAATLFLALSVSIGSCVSLLSAIAVAAFPTKLRSLAMCTMYMCGQVGTVVGICCVSVMDKWVCNIVFTVIVLFMLTSFAFLFMFWPDLHIVREEMESKDFTY